MDFAHRILLLAAVNFGVRSADLTCRRCEPSQAYSWNVLKLSLIWLTQVSDFSR